MGMCECGHHSSWHKAFLPPTAFGAGFGECKGYTGSGTNWDYKPCQCRAFEPYWTGPRDARTGEPIKPLSTYKAG